ncbi:hypothetical protein B0H17DRAFT_1050887 [Mycena rosella]|uniref:Uncharacterized protein n=1 Tax=Mycena rosella TaxID=1033263 RepID=A0AAD7GJU6_MYCRO|nr:hypothetical protein B0H17DRAFT_1050887 [Mycena rosella]
MLGSAALLGWVLASPHPFPQLTSVTIELYKGASTREHYHATLRGMAQRPALTTLSLQIYSWLPWAPKNFDAAAAPEREARHIADLRLTFKHLAGMGRSPAPLVKWLRLFCGVREVSMFDPGPIKNICAILGRELPQMKFTSYKLGK